VSANALTVTGRNARLRGLDNWISALTMPAEFYLFSIKAFNLEGYALAYL
jgi:hypothetical protein